MYCYVKAVVPQLYFVLNLCVFDKNRHQFYIVKPQVVTLKLCSKLKSLNFGLRFAIISSILTCIVCSFSWDCIYILMILKLLWLLPPRSPDVLCMLKYCYNRQTHILCVAIFF